MVGTPKKMPKWQFENMIRNSGAISPDEIRFEYVRNGNDEWNGNRYQRKMATYEFYVITPKGRSMIVYRQHNRTHDEVEDELRKQYGYWVKCALAK